MPSDPTDGADKKRRTKLMRRLRLPLASGKTSAFTLAICFALSAGLVWLVAARLDVPSWVRWEIIVAVWWLVWFVALAKLLHRGVRVSDDHTLRLPRSWLGGDWFKGNSSWTADFGTADSCGEGCAVALGVIVAIIVAFVALWFVVEIAIPVIAFLLYVLIRAMLARVANDFHGCTANLGRALLWGAVWATAYTAPLALFIWLGHVVVKRAHGG